MPTPEYLTADDLWQEILSEVRLVAEDENSLKDFFQQSCLQHESLAEALGAILENKFYRISEGLITKKLVCETYSRDSSLLQYTANDLQAIRQRDSACIAYFQALCFYKGFHALAMYRVMHQLWRENRQALSLMIQSNISSLLDVDIHPAAQLGSGIMLDHATGIVIGETAVVGNNVSLMQSVTLGGTGKESGDRHPKIGDDVLVSVGAKILGNITVGEGAHIAAGSVVLKPVPEHSLAAGVPAKVIGKAHSPHPAQDMDHKIS
jgi:serine O-acetyltransferase